MRKRNIQKIVRFNRKEAQDLAAKARRLVFPKQDLSVYLSEVTNRKRNPMTVSMM